VRKAAFVPPRTIESIGCLGRRGDQLSAVGGRVNLEAAADLLGGEKLEL
jgi:hypothetical protein